MHPDFAQLTVQWFKRAYVYTGSIGEFRYRFKRDGETLSVATYTHLCYEVATDVAEQEFPWTEEGVEAIKAHLQAKFNEYQEKSEA